MIAKNSKEIKQKPITFKKRIGKIISFLHLWLGLAAGTVLVVVSLTGCILAFEDELTPIFYPHEQKIEPAAVRLSADSLVAIANSSYPKKKIFRLYLPAEKDKSVKMTFGTKKKGYDFLYINQYNGKVLSKGKENNRFFVVVLNLHRFLLAGEIGKTITGISCAITFFMVISGLYLWWPGHKKGLKQRLTIKTDGNNKRLNWDLHAVGGFYAMIFLFMITLTGLIWSYNWVESLMFKIADGKKEKAELIKEKDGKFKKQVGVYESVIKVTDSIYPGAGEIMITFPDKKGKPFTISKNDPASAFDIVNQAYLDSRTASVIKIAPFKDLSLGSKLRKLNKPIHTGSILGCPTKTIAFLTALIAASLPVTGFLIWWGRGKKSKKKKTVTST